MSFRCELCREIIPAGKTEAIQKLVQEGRAAELDLRDELSYFCPGCARIISDIEAHTILRTRRGPQTYVPRSWKRFALVRLA